MSSATSEQALGDPDKVGLALSGGGFRATLFALGSLCRLNELGYLRRITRISSVSGGSIIAGFLGFRWRELTFDASGQATNFGTVIVDPIRSFCTRLIDVPAILKGLLIPFTSVGGQVARAYERELFRKSDGSPATLQDLPDDTEGPRFVICATSLQTRACVRLSKPYIADFNLGQLPKPNLRLAVAVAASSAFPPFLSPIRLRTEAALWSNAPANPSPNLKVLRSRLVLTDAGVYDNLGLEPLKDCGTVFCADAGGPASFQMRPHGNWLGQLTRAREILMEQTRALRRRKLIAELQTRQRAGAFWGVATRIGDYELDDVLTEDSAVTRRLANVRTRLAPFTECEQVQLINWGYALCDAALRKHVKPGPRPIAWPAGGSYAFPIKPYPPPTA